MVWQSSRLSSLCSDRASFDPNLHQSMEPEAQNPPALRTKTTHEDINGVGTDIAVTIFVDRVFIVVTQLGTFGTLVEAFQKDTMSGRFQPETHIRLGKRDDPLLLVYARQLLEHFGVPLGLPIVAALGIKDRSSGTFEVIMKAVDEVFKLARSETP